MRVSSVALALAIAGCEAPQLPTLPSPTTTTTSVEPFNPGPEFTWNTRGILVFAGTQATEAEIRALDQRVKGWPYVPTYHVCAEVQTWEHTPWADGPEAFSEENVRNLRRFLTVTADLGSQVLLDVICTMKEDGTSRKEMLRWAALVGQEVAQYRHVAIHIANEFIHPNSSFSRDYGFVGQLRDAISHPRVGTDVGAHPGGLRYPEELRRLGFWPDFHPWRNPDPTRRELEALRDRNSWGRVVISEPTAYSSWRGGGCCTANKNQILRYMERAEAAGIVWFFHSTDGLQWPQVEFEWIP